MSDYRKSESARRGQKIMTETAAPRDDDSLYDSDLALSGKDMKGGDDDLSRTVRNGSVPAP
jgi:hypothetical protein